MRFRFRDEILDIPDARLEQESDELHAWLVGHVTGDARETTTAYPAYHFTDGNMEPLDEEASALLAEWAIHASL